MELRVRQATSPGCMETNLARVLPPARAPKHQSRARAPGICASSRRGGGPYNAAHSVFSASEHGTGPSLHETTTAASSGFDRGFSEKTATKGRGDPLYVA
jgi:hypothetical protein